MTALEGIAAQAKLFAGDFEVQQCEPLCYQLPGALRNVVLEDDAGTKQEVTMGQSYFVLRSQDEDLNFIALTVAPLLPAPDGGPSPAADTSALRAPDGGRTGGFRPVAADVAGRRVCLVFYQ